MQSNDVRAATEHFNTGAEIPSVEPFAIEKLWEAIRSIPKEQRQNTAMGLGFLAQGDPDCLPQSPELQVAMTLRYTLLDALVERGILDTCIEDESMRKKVFSAAASFPCNQEDLGELLMQRLLRDSPPDAAQKTTEELRQAGYDPGNPKVGERFIEWMRNNC